jgi:hypothetical protein
MAPISDNRSSSDSTIGFEKHQLDLESSETPLINSTDTYQWAQQKKSCVPRRLVHSIIGSIILAIVLLVGFTALQTWKVQQHVHLYPSGLELGTCGYDKTPEEARAHGCVFDPMSFIWVRPECYHGDLLEDFMKRSEWAWYSDPQLKHKLPMDEVFNGDHPQAFAPKQYHQIHCTYMWRKMHSVLVDRLPIDSDLSSWHHTMHCEKVLLNHILHEDANCTDSMVCPTWVRATWTTCGYY